MAALTWTDFVKWVDVAAHTTVDTGVAWLPQFFLLDFLTSLLTCAYVRQLAARKWTTVRSPSVTIVFLTERCPIF